MSPSSSHASALARAERVLTNAEILALNTTPIALVPAVAGNYIVPLAAVLSFAGTPYVETGSLRFFVAASWATADWGTSLTNVFSANLRVSPISFLSLAIGTTNTTAAHSAAQPFNVDTNLAYSGGPGTLTVAVTYMTIPA